MQIVVREKEKGREKGREKGGRQGGDREGFDMSGGQKDSLEVLHGGRLSDKDRQSGETVNKTPDTMLRAPEGPAAHEEH